MLGRRHRYHSKKFETRRDAKNHEAEFKMKIKDATDYSDLTFKDLIIEYTNYQKDKVKVTTLHNYETMKPYIEPLFNIKLSTFNIRHYEMWRQYLNAKPLSTRYKNGIYKYLKTLLNFGNKWYDISFYKVYNKMTNFNNPNEIKKEMLFYTYEEFQQFISDVDNIKWKTIFQILYYCGLRRGELLGLQWKDINFTRNTMSISKQITARSGTIKNFHFCVPKTKSSIRTIPFGKVLRKSLEMCKIEASKVNGFVVTLFH